MKNFVLAMICVLCSFVTVEAACRGGNCRAVRRAPVVRKVFQQRVSHVRLRGVCSNGRCSR